MVPVKRSLRRAVHAIESEGRARWRGRVLAIGNDTTSRSASASVLVVAPHPDDETLGCGATIARKRAAGTRVRVLVATNGSGSHRSETIDQQALADLRADEVREACRRLGVATADVTIVSAPDGSVRERLSQLVAAITQELDEFVTEEVLVTSAHDWHPDHRACNEAVRQAVASRPAERRPRLLEYPVWYWQHGPWAADRGGPWAARQAGPFLHGLIGIVWVPPADLVGTSGFLAQKRHALEAHRSQLTNLTGEPGWAVLDVGFVASFFLSHEISFPVTV